MVLITITGMTNRGIAVSKSSRNIEESNKGTQKNPKWFLQ